MEAPAIFVLEPIGVDGALEANGTVYYFCTFGCRLQWRNKTPNIFTKSAYSPDYCEGTVCDECGRAI